MNARAYDRGAEVQCETNSWPADAVTVSASHYERLCETRMPSEGGGAVVASDTTIPPCAMSVIFRCPVQVGHTGLTGAQMFKGERWMPDVVTRYPRNTQR